MTKHAAEDAAVAAPAQPGRRFTSYPPSSCRRAAAQGRMDPGAAGAAARATGSWLDAVPRRAEHDDDWMEKHPSALAGFESVLAAAKGKQVVMFLDYDGTLSPIVKDPDTAVMTEEMRDAVRGVAEHFPTAIVSGRCRDKLAELYYAGSHGMDIKGPTPESKHAKAKAEAVLCQPASEFLPVIDEVYRALTATTAAIPGATVENNKFCLSVHFRCVQEEKWSALEEQVRSVLKEFPDLRLTRGRKVLEIRPSIKWDKGNALQFLLEALGFADSNNVFPIYIGDDRTDEDAFKVLRDMGQGIGILVSKIPKETSASYSLREPSEVKEFLHKLVKSKQSTTQRD
ncbi:trehalose 6-phosphate phosphatase RA3-like isoform X2 [Panicum virgatum]|uniref:trehalose 6-phosphate phosphatase RA3-like isoform X2 n=1 Tax=Panicum virgatum TaxID=38727 RepID=UPI0019D5D9D4|nr:trehalose 6-phosphate phosphatase RA3-like isoform X2 [Panicum virgatum]